MKKTLCLVLAVLMLTALAACGKGAKEWSRSGYYEDENGHMLSLTWMEMDEGTGWYAGFMYGPDAIEDSYGGMVTQQGKSLRGDLLSGGDRIAITVKITEEGEDGLLFEVGNGETCHFKPADFNEGPEIDLGDSKLYTEDELKAAVEAIKKQFEEFEGCVLYNIRYAGDEANNEENLKWMNELNEDGNYTQVAQFLSDFHSPVEEAGAWNPDSDYLDWQWWLARSGDGDWDVLTWGYG